MTVWFTSDTHYGHAHVIDYAKRPFVSVEEMDEALVSSWNAVVKPGDSVYHLGDFALTRPERAAEIVRRLKGQKFLIFGNHDTRLRDHGDFVAAWVWARDLTQIRVGTQKIMLCHYAMRTWASAHHGAWQLYGHSHGSLAESPTMRSTDVGVDCWGYAPVAFETLQERMAARNWEPVDHHDEG
jgi:calcineurin-like phosphoesterase family protein